MHLPFATIDTGRKERTGHNECIWGQNKSAKELSLIIEKLIAHSPDDSFLITRVSSENMNKSKNFYHRFCLSVLLLSKFWMFAHPENQNLNQNQESKRGPAPVGILVAGTSDLYVAEEGSSEHYSIVE